MERSARSNQAVPVLLYHSVPAAAAAGDPLSVSQAQFEAHVRAIAASGRAPVLVSEIAAWLRGLRTLPQRAVAITFDDAYDDTLAAVELLGAHGLRASVYVTTGQLDSGSMVSTEHLRQMARWPQTVELGAHSVTHPALDELGQAELEREVRESKRALERIVGRGVDTFAYPFGAYDARVRAAVIAAGFESAAAVKNALSHSADDPWAIARWTVDGTISADRIARVIEGQGVPLAWHRQRVRTRGWRAARRLRRRLGLGASSWR